MRFTREEFDTMVDELLYSETVSFDTLCHIATKTLKPSVINWCKDDDRLRGRGYEDDIMQNIHVRLIKTTINSFLIRDDIKGPYNNNPEGFEDWMFTVAKNIKKDFAEKVNNNDSRTIDIENPSVVIIEHEGNNGYEEREERRKKLEESLSIVLSADVSIYKVLTWLAQFIFILDADVTKRESNTLMLKAFESKTLYEMYDMILAASKRIPWIVISKSQHEKILDSLRKSRDGNVTYGESRYSDFFMKQNGEISGTKSISDWTNRMNGFVKKKMGYEKDVTKKIKAIKKRRGENGTTSDS